MTRPHSLSAKLRALAPGETLFLPDRHDMRSGVATAMERQVQALVHRPAMADLRVTTKRCLTVFHIEATAQHALAVTRL